MTDHVQFSRDGAAACITLNRPGALHALSQEMCEAMTAQLLEWRADDGVQVVLLDHAEGTRGFCAGGDVLMVRDSALNDGGKAGRAFFFHEYRLNHLLFTFPKPVVAFMDGVTMGGGVGLALPCDYRIATERTMFAMPEGAIGLFPDVGAGWYLPRLRGCVGKFLALTGARLDGSECKWAGLATHYMSSDQVSIAKTRIMNNPEDVHASLAMCAVPPPPARLEENAWRIDTLFAHDTLEQILAGLEADGSEWSDKELEAVRRFCPTTAKVSLRLLQEGAEAQDFASHMQREYRIACRMFMRADFIEGVRAVLVEKDNAPQWDPVSPGAIDPDMLDEIFAPLPEGEEWTPVSHP